MRLSHPCAAQVDEARPQGDGDARPSRIRQYAFSRDGAAVRVRWSLDAPNPVSFAIPRHDGALLVASLETTGRTGRSEAVEIDRQGRVLSSAVLPEASRFAPWADVAREAVTPPFDVSLLDLEDEFTTEAMRPPRVANAAAAASHDSQLGGGLS